MIDLHLFLGRSLSFASDDHKKHEVWEDFIGSVPQVIIDEEIQSVKTIVNHDIKNLETVIDNAYK